MRRLGRWPNIATAPSSWPGGQSLTLMRLVEPLAERAMIAISGLLARPAYARQAAALLTGTVLDDAACARAGEMAVGEVAAPATLITMPRRSKDRPHCNRPASSSRCNAWP